ncbi:MAG: hypothetical protein ACTHLR_09520 [Rhizomicrobium sp.]
MPDITLTDFLTELRAKRVRRAFALGSCVVVAGIFLTGGFFAAQRKCLSSAASTSAQLATLNAEIGARRSALVGALQAAETTQDLRRAAQYLGSTPPKSIGGTSGRTLGDLNYEREQLRASIAVDDPDGLRKAEVPRPIDPWVLQNYPVDQFGFLLGASTNDLATLRLAAREELLSFQAGLIIPPHSGLEVVPNCSLMNTVAYYFLGTEPLLLRKKRGVSAEGAGHEKGPA